jgi:AcrR family transcriptional regulator
MHHRERPLSVETQAGPGADRLKQAAFELACSQGLAALSARALALHMGGSASAVNYHFGNREKLLLALYGEVATHCAEARASALTFGLAAIPDWADWPHVFAAVLEVRLERARGATLLLHELEHEIVSGREPQLREAAQEEIQRERQFWLGLAHRFDVEEHAASAWADFAIGLTSLLLGEEEAAGRGAWSSAPAVRLHQRICRQQVVLVPRRQQAFASRAVTALPASKTAQVILDASLATIARHGADRLTQREVAALAGVSLASVTYFFRTKNDLINAAFEELCQRMREGVRAVESRDPADFAEANSMLRESNGLTMLAALNALLRAAARDATLVPIAREIRQLRGIGSFVLLHKRGVQADWVDAYVWGVLVAGSARQCLLTHPDDPAAAIEAAATRNMKTMLDIDGETSTVA